MSRSQLVKAIVPVIDLCQGRVVHARSGLPRHGYPPLRSRICPGDRPDEVAQRLVAASGSPYVYVADLDGLRGRSPDWPALRAIAQCGAELWIDIGLRSQHTAGQLQAEMGDFRYRPIVATESLSTTQSLRTIIRQWPVSQLIAGMDLVRGQLRTDVLEWKELQVFQLAEILVELGISSMLLLDLSAVGSETGCPAAGWCRELKSRHRKLHLIGGGGIGRLADVAELLDAGCEHVLVATALHDGRIDLACR